MLLVRFSWLNLASQCINVDLVKRIQFFALLLQPFSHISKGCSSSIDTLLMAACSHLMHRHPCLSPASLLSELPQVKLFEGEIATYWPSPNHWFGLQPPTSHTCSAIQSSMPEEFERIVTHTRRCVLLWLFIVKYL